jgi:phage protein U
MPEKPVIALGEHKFTTTTAAFAELSRASEYKWQEQARVTNDPVLQFTGYGVETLTLPLAIGGGVGNPTTLSSLRGAADRATVFPLIDSKGAFHGNWVVKSIAETQKFFNPDGSARKIEFNVTLNRYSR